MRLNSMQRTQNTLPQSASSSALRALRAFLDIAAGMLSHAGAECCGCTSRRLHKNTPVLDVIMSLERGISDKQNLAAILSTSETPDDILHGWQPLYPRRRLHNLLVYSWWHAFACLVPAPVRCSASSSSCCGGGSRVRELHDCHHSRGVWAP